MDALSLFRCQPSPHALCGRFAVLFPTHANELEDHIARFTAEDGRGIARPFLGTPRALEFVANLSCFFIHRHVIQDELLPTASAHTPYLSKGLARILAPRADLASG